MSCERRRLGYLENCGSPILIYGSCKSFRWNALELSQTYKWALRILTFTRSRKIRIGYMVVRSVRRFPERKFGASEVVLYNAQDSLYEPTLRITVIQG